MPFFQGEFGNTCSWSGLFYCHGMLCFFGGTNMPAFVSFVKYVLLFSSSLYIKAATKCDSMTLTPGPWLGLPAVPAVTLYINEDPALVNWTYFKHQSSFYSTSYGNAVQRYDYCVQKPDANYPPWRLGQSLAAGLTSSQPVEKLRALPLWLSLQYLGHDGIVQRIKHASHLVSTLPT